MEKKLERARILVEALPYIQRFRGKIMVLKLGGKLFEDEELLDAFARDIVLLKEVGIGGGPQLDKMMERMGIKVEKVEGLRATDEQSMEVVEMVLCGKLNRQLVMKINLVGGKALGLSGKDGMMILAKQHFQSIFNPSLEQWEWWKRLILS